MEEDEEEEEVMTLLLEMLEGSDGLPNETEDADADVDADADDEGAMTAGTTLTGRPNMGAAPVLVLPVPVLVLGAAPAAGVTDTLAGRPNRGAVAVAGDDGRPKSGALPAGGGGGLLLAPAGGSDAEADDEEAEAEAAPLVLPAGGDAPRPRRGCSALLRRPRADMFSGGNKKGRAQ